MNCLRKTTIALAATILLSGPARAEEDTFSLRTLHRDLGSS